MVEAKVGFDAIKELWGYNRENFLYDRRMRQEQELKVAEWRCTQAELWREDVRDLVGLTERKMDSYLVVNTLQLGMCVALFTEGRLKPGTPHWLLHFYMLTLGAAFMYLLMSVWLAMHASVVAACESVRILTQSVRLPIPTWEQLESMRTYAASYETLGRNQLRIPFIDQLMKTSGSEADTTKENSSSGSADPSSSKSAAPVSDAAPAPDANQNIGVQPECMMAESRFEDAKPVTGAMHDGVDTWGLESAGREIYELQRRPLVSNRHVNLVKRAASHYQCHDAFARVAMSFGTNQLLFAISYYCLGYVSVGDGAPWPAGIIAIIMSGIAASLVKLDFQFSRLENRQALLLVLTGPLCSSVATCAWITREPSLQIVTMMLLPIAYAAHALWLLFALRACKVEVHPGGAMLPTKFRTVQYLDVFGWLHHEKKPVQNEEKKPQKLAIAAKTIAAKGGNYTAMPLTEKNTYSPPSTPPTQALEKDYAQDTQFDKPLTCTVLSSGSSRGRATSPDAAGAHAHLVTNIQANLALYKSDAAQRVMDEDAKARVENISRRLQAVIGEAALRKGTNLDVTDSMRDKTSHFAIYGSSSEHISEPSCSEPDCEPWVNSKQREFSKQVSRDDEKGPSNSRPPSARCCQAAPSQGQWQEMHYYTDFGTEVPYLYDPQTGQVQHTFVDGFPSRCTSKDFIGREGTFSRQGSFEISEAGDLMFSLSYAEECIDRLEKMARTQGSSKPSSRSSSRTTSKTSSSQVQDEMAKASAAHVVFDKTSSIASGAWLTDMEKRCKHAAAERWPWLLGDVDESWEEDEEDEDELWTPQTRVRRMSTRRLSHLTPGDDRARAKLLAQIQQGSRSAPRYKSISNVEPEDPVGTNEVILAMEPDKIPWKVFRNATLLLVLLWTIGPAQSFGLLGGITEFGPRMRVSVDGSQTVHDAEPKYRGTMRINPGEESQYLSEVPEEDYPALAEGSLMKVTWPWRSGLRANVLSCDTSGRHLVVADDFGVYAGRIRESGDAKKKDMSGLGETGLRGSSLQGYQVSFARAPPCTALEGQALKDIGIVCSRHNPSHCHVLVLHTNGQLLTQCPLLDSGKDGVERPVVTWQIAGDWLDVEEEQVESVAVNDECGEEEADRDVHKFYPDEVGCVVVGTTSGRVVQLRRHVTKEHQLVPEWAMQQRHNKVGQGSLHVFPGGFVITLRTHSIQALDARNGNVIGEWELPQVDSVRWLTICGGGNNIYLLGRDREDKSQLWRFPVPPELRAAMISRQEDAKSDPARKM